MTPPAVVSALTVDCHDPTALARFWQAMLGGETVDYPDLGVVALRAPGVTLDFARVPEEKQGKNRWHLDLATDDADRTIDTALAVGASRAAGFADTEGFTVLCDPEGNEFCVLWRMPAHRPWAPPDPV